MVPSFPGCEGTNEELKECLSKKMGRFIQKKFNSDLANELGLSPGIQRIYTVFKIDKTGNIIDVKIKAVHKRLEKEGIRVVGLLPNMKPSILTGIVLSFAHTVGEFGVVLMLGGNIPGETQVLSIALYNHVEMLSYDKAHNLALVLLCFSFVSLTLLYKFNKSFYTLNKS